MLINTELIHLNLESTTKEEVINSLAKTAYEQNKISNVEEYTRAVLHRESEYSTAVGFGVAIPHGKTDAVNEPFLMFAKVNPLDWQALDGEPVDIIFMIGVPEKDAGSVHLKILAGLSRKLMREEFRNTLRTAQTPEEILQLLRESEIGL